MHLAIWAITAATICAIVVRPFRIAEWVWAVVGAGLLVAVHAISGTQAADAARDGADVYAFLVGMLALAELARLQGVFDWAASLTAKRMNGNASRLFTAVFGGAVIVTALLSNDGTILLLTPAVIALARGTRLSAAPFAYAVAFVANGASFLLPISNPANLVVFSPLPKLLPWLALFIAPSAVAIACIYGVLRVLHKRELQATYDPETEPLTLTRSGRLTLDVVSTALGLLVVAAAIGLPVGYAALVLGAIAVAVVALADRTTPRRIAREAPWSILPLVAGLFVVMRALDATGVLEHARALLRDASTMHPILGRLYAGTAVTIADALVNNLPVGVAARYALHAQGIAPHVAHAVLVGVDLGPNLSINASLATLLWAMMLRREGIAVNAWRFLLIGAAVTIPSLALALIVVR